MSAGESFLSWCWSCCACLSISTSKGKVAMSCNESCSAWWSVKKKKKKERKKPPTTKQQNRLSWIQNEEHFIFLFLPLFCLKMRCFPLKDEPKYKKIYVKLQYDIIIIIFIFLFFLCDKRPKPFTILYPPPPPPPLHWTIIGESCHKYHFLSWHNFVATNTCLSRQTRRLSRQKWYLW